MEYVRPNSTATSFLRGEKCSVFLPSACSLSLSLSDESKDRNFVGNYTGVRNRLVRVRGAVAYASPVTHLRAMIFYSTLHEGRIEFSI